MNDKPAFENAIRERPMVPLRLRIRKFGFRPPELIVLGSQHNVDRIDRKLGHYNIKLRKINAVSDLASRLGTDTVGIIIARPSLDALRDMRRIKLLGLSPSVLTINLLDGAADHTVAQDLYRLGADVVMDWPEDDRYLGQLVLELLRMGKGSQRRSLANYLRVKLKLLAESLKVFRLSVKDGVAHVVGHVESFQQKIKLKKIIEETPGVRRVILNAVHVPEGSGVDEELEYRVVKKLEQAPAIRDSTLRIDVKDREVAVAGIAADRSEVAHIIKRIAAVDGVREVTSTVKIAPKQKQLDLGLVQEIERRLEGLFFESEVKVKVIEGTATLTGRVNMSRKAQIATDAVKDVPGLGKIVNLISVREPAMI